MLIGAHLPQRFWAEALTTAVYLRNRNSTKSVSGVTPSEALFGKKPSVNHLRIFGCVAYAHISREERRKLDPKAKKCILLGYGTNVKGYRLYCLEEQTVFYSRDVIFNEKKFGFEDQYSEKPELVEIDLPEVVFQNVNADNERVEESDSTIEDPAIEDSVIEDTVDESAADEISVRRSNRQRKRPDHYGVWINSAQQTDCQVPTTYEEVLTSPEKQKWLDAMNEEMSSFEINDVYDLIEQPKDKKAIGSKWVYKRKFNSDGLIERYKARLVVQGFSQRWGQDYDETFCPVVRFKSFRSIMAIAAQNQLIVHKMDVTSAFLNGDLNENVYMKQLSGFEVTGKEHLVCKLKKSVYGLKQAPRCWNMKLDQKLKQMGFKSSESDPCIYMRNLFIIAVYVDDMVVVTKNGKEMKDVKKAISDVFNVNDLGELHYFLGEGHSRPQKKTM
jgi:hypothetical protein